MTPTPADAANAPLAGLEIALRDAATRAMKLEMPLLLAMGFFQIVASLARCLRQFRKIAGLPRAFAPDLVALLDSVHAVATSRLSDPGLTQSQALRLLRLLEGLSRAMILARPTPEKAKKPGTKPFALRSAIPETAMPVQPVVPRRRPNDWDNIGTIAARAMDAAAPRNPVLDAAMRAVLDSKRAA
jgi:hypothetical protein